MTSRGRVRALIAAAGLAVATFLTGTGAAHAVAPVRGDAGSQIAAVDPTAVDPTAADPTATGALAAPAPHRAPPGHLAAARGSVPISPDLDARLDRAGSVPVETDSVAPPASAPLAAATSSPSHARAPPAGVLS